MNTQRIIESVAGGAGIGVRFREPNLLILDGPGIHHEIELVRLLRPTPTEVSGAAGKLRLLMLIEPNRSAREAARLANHIALPDGELRITLPGVVLIAPARETPRSASPVRLRGASGVVAEALMLNPRREFTVRELAQCAAVSVGLVHRVLGRLRREGLVGGERGFVVKDPDSLLRLWASENRDLGRPFAKAYCYGGRPLDVVRRVQERFPLVCVAGALAANSYVSRLSNDPPPFKLWLPTSDGSPEALLRVKGLEVVEEGANLEFSCASGDPWMAFADRWEGVLRVSRPRCFIELYHSTGRVQELAQALLEGLR